MTRITLLTVSLLISFAVRAAAADSGDVLATLKKDHPRLLVLDDDIARVKRDIVQDPTAKDYFDRLKVAGDAMLAQPPEQRVLLGPRLLGVSQRVLRRTQTLGGLYRLTGERKYAERCKGEMRAVAKFSDWHPAHFLDTAEMTNAMAIGYDWTYDALTPDERVVIRDAIVEKGLKPGLEAYAGNKGWLKNTNNWNQVCNGGLTVGALAVADEEPDVARRVIESARASIPKALALFGPDGGWIEGPGYWNYATRYTVYYLAAVRTALGTDFGFMATPGLAETGMFRMDVTGPGDRAFNFADCTENEGGASQMFWLARAFDRPVYAAHERMVVARSPKVLDLFHLLWFTSAGSEEDVEKLPRGALFRNVEAAMFRSASNDPAAAYVGFKGGDNAASHGHLDLGTFVYDVDGVRWAIDLGADDYNLPGYFGKQRWDYYRLRTEGHNTLLLGGENQNTKGKSKIVAFSAGPERMFAVADLTEAYAAQATRVVRGVELVGKQLIVQDELEADAPVEIAWQMHTRAKISVADDGRRAVLASGDGKRVTARIVAGDDARFDVAESDPKPGADPNPPMREIGRGGKKLVVRFAERKKELRMVVVLAPEGEVALKREIEPSLLRRLAK